MRVVLDTNVVASAILWGGAPRQLLQAARKKRIEIFSSMPMLAEFADILGRRKFARQLAASLLTIDQIVERYAQLTSVVRPVATPRIAPDPDDDMVIGTALAAKAAFVVTGDKPLLSIADYQGVRIVGVTQAIEIINAGSR